MRSKKGISVHKVMGSGRSLSGMFVFLLISLYAIFALLLVIIGAGVYQRVVNDSERNAQTRTSLCYIASKVRANDEAGAVTVENIQGTPVLSLRQQFDQDTYYTRIYYQPDVEASGGALYELFSSDVGADVDLSSGERIVDVSMFTMSEVNGGIDLRVTTKDGMEETMHLSLLAQAAR